MYKFGVKFDSQTVSYKRRVVPLYENSKCFEEYDDSKQYDLVLTDDLNILVPKNTLKVFYQSNDLLSYPVEWVRPLYKPLGYFKKLIRFLRLHRQLSCFDSVITASHLQARSYGKIIRDVFYKLDPVVSEVLIQGCSAVTCPHSIDVAIECSGLNVNSILCNQEFVEAINFMQDVKLHVVIDDCELPRSFRNRMVHSRLKSTFGSKVVLYDWSKENVAKVITLCGVGVVPVDSQCAFAANKPENRATIMLKNGLPVVLTPTVAHLNLSRVCGTAYAVTKSQWVNAIKASIHVAVNPSEFDFGEQEFARSIEEICNQIVGTHDR